MTTENEILQSHTFDLIKKYIISEHEDPDKYSYTPVEKYLYLLKLTPRLEIIFK
ncbi:MAG TPA: hypothetical protein PKY81_09150 [bacterium]|nr:hypothetical protein [bacterium]